MIIIIKQRIEKMCVAGLSLNAPKISISLTELGCRNSERSKRLLILTPSNLAGSLALFLGPLPTHESPFKGLKKVGIKDVLCFLRNAHPGLIHFQLLNSKKSSVSATGFLFCFLIFAATQGKKSLLLERGRP